MSNISSLKNVDLNKVLKELLPYIDTSIYLDPLTTIRLGHGLQNELVFEVNSLIITSSDFFNHPVIKKYPYVVKGLFTILNLRLDDLNNFPYKIDDFSIDNCVIKNLKGSVKEVNHFFCFKSSGFKDLQNIFNVKNSINLFELNDLISLKGIDNISLVESLTISSCYNIREVDFLPLSIKNSLIIKDNLIKQIKADLNHLKCHISFSKNAFSEKEVIKIFQSSHMDYSNEEMNKIILSQNEGRKLLIIKDNL